jgi:sugar phosphate isomerase/epimerase
MTSSSTVHVGISIAVHDSTMSDLPAALETAARLGVASVELPLCDMDIVVGAKIRRKRLAIAKAATSAAGLAYSLHGHLGINLMTPEPHAALHFDVLRANIDIAAELHCRHLVIHSGFCPKRQAPDIEAAYARQREALHRAGDIAAEHGVTLCVENVFEHDGRGHTATPARLAAELARLAHPHVKATFDFGHAFLHTTDVGLDYMAEARALAPFARHLHIHDGFGRPKDVWTATLTEDMAFGIGDLHLPLGWGAVPWDAIARDCRFPDTVVANIELHDRFWSEAQATVDAVKAWSAKLRTAVQRTAAE